MRKLAEMIVRVLEKRTIIPAADHDVYVYGFDAALYTFLSTVGLMLIGCVLGQGIETLILIALFYVNQTLGGGFHASTFLLPFNQWVYCILGTVGLMFMIKYPLVLHKNKEYLQAKHDILCKRSRGALLVQGICLMAIALWGKNEYLQAFCVASGVCAMSRLVAVFQKAKGRNA